MVAVHGSRARTCVLVYQYQWGGRMHRNHYLVNLTNVVAEWLSLPLRIPEIPGSNLGPKAGNAY
jgi:hypothetical protein